MPVTTHQSFSNTRLIIVMGTSGCGKSTIGKQLAEQLSAAYIEGDDLHSQQNKDKMGNGIALVDDDRWPWLASIGQALQTSRGKAVGSCSALKRCYRELITDKAGEPVLFIYLEGSKAVLATRLANRSGHFMNAELLDSQLAALEPPSDDEYSVRVKITKSVTEIVDEIQQKMRS